MERIESYLAGEERLIWQGYPRKGVYLKASDAFMIPFSLVWGGFAIFWEWSVLKTEGQVFFKPWGIPFVAIGFYMIFGRFIYDALIREKTQYAVTNQRVLIVSGLFRPEIKSRDLRNLGEMSLALSSKDRGTIAFGDPVVNKQFWLGDDGRLKLEMIERARTVHDLIRTAQQEAMRFAGTKTSQRW